MFTTPTAPTRNPSVASGDWTDMDISFPVSPVLTRNSRVGAGAGTGGERCHETDCMFDIEL